MCARSRERRLRRFRAAGGGEGVGRTCSEHKRREHKGAFLDTAVLRIKGPRVSLGAVRGVGEETESGD